MQSYEVNLMSGMVDILNRSLEKPILTPEQYEERLADLKQFEEDVDFMFTNSPNCPIDLQSIVKVKMSNVQTTDFKECNNTEDIIEFANQKDMLIYMDIDGVDMSITYTDGVITKIEVDSALIDVKKICNVPYKINESGTYIVKGKVAIESNKIIFITHNIVKDDSTNLKEDLTKAKDLGFDVVPNWLAVNLNPKNLQGSLDYVYELASEEEFSCMGVVFEFNNKKDKGRIVYRMQNE